MAVHLTTDQNLNIRADGEGTYPHECCGFLLGRIEYGERRVERIEPVGNEREDDARHNRYLITPDIFMKVERQARKEGLDVLGFYHSHPDAPARPSVFDTEHAWPWYVYIIVAIEKGASAAMTAWILKDDRTAFDEQPITIHD